MTNLQRDVILGAAAGVVGTAAMTLLMKPGLPRFLPEDYRPSEFVPKQIIEWAEELVAGPDTLSEAARWWAASLAHVGYGAAMGALYAVIRRRTDALSAAAAGPLWGAVVWAAGHEGWLPAAGVRPATTDHPPQQWPVPIANHLLYGLVTALTYEYSLRHSVCPCRCIPDSYHYRVTWRVAASA